MQRQKHLQPAKGAKISSPGISGFLEPAWKQGWLACLLLLVATSIAYLPVRHAGFIWDDDRYVTNNPLLAAPDGLQRIWFSQDAPSQYVPLVYTTLRLEYSLWRLNPAGYHWDNVLLHALNAILLWRLLKRLRVPGDWLAAAIFALHPVQVESVAWISERKNVLSLLFYLLSVRSWTEFVEAQPKQSWRPYLLSLLFCALALLSKATACTLPAALVLVMWLKKKPISGLRMAQIIPFVALGLGMGLLVMWWERYHQGTEGGVFLMSPPERLLVASRAIWFYLGKLIWPVNLTFIYPQWTINPASPPAYGWLLAGMGLGAAIYLTRHRLGRSVATAAAFYVATLGPLLGFIMLYTFRYSFVADHYQYVASIGPVSLVAAGITTALGRYTKTMPQLQPVVCGTLLLLLGTLTWQQAGIYQDRGTLWRDTLKKNPGCWMAENNLANFLTQQGQIDDAIPHYYKSLEITPNADAHYNLGVVLARQGRLESAIGHLEKAVKLEPGSFKAHNNLGMALISTGLPGEAIGHFETALKLNPRFMTAHLNLAATLNKQGRVDEAIHRLQQALALKPNDAEVKRFLTQLLLAKESATLQPASPP